MLYTSYFSSKAPRGRKVCIAKWAPRYWQGPRVASLAPTNPKAEDWQAAYLADLEARFPQGAGLKQVLERIETETPGAILCCYEADPAECHRRILANYARQWLGIEIGEWQPPSRHLFLI